jgi:hypothetical protein
MFLSNQRVQRIAARIILCLIIICVGVVVHEVTTSVAQNNAKEVVTNEVNRTIVETDVIHLLSVGPEMTPQTPNNLSSNNKMQQEIAEVTINQEPNISEFDIQPKEEKVVEAEDQRAIESYNLTTHEQPETKYKYYEVLDFTDNNWYSMDKDLQEYTYDLCVEYGIEDYFTLLLSQFYAESRYDPKAISGTGDYGIGQINKCNHARLKKELGITDFLNAKQGVLCTVYLMSDYLTEFDTADEALVYYNTGRHRSSNPYSKRVMKFFDTVREIKERTE